MNEPKEYIGEFAGRVIQKEGTKQNGEAYINYRLNFKIKEGQQYGFGIGMFSPSSLQNSLKVEQLVEGQTYKVIYGDSLKMNQYGKPFKELVSINVAQQGEVAPQQQQTPTATGQVNLAGWEKFYPQYFELCKNKGMTPNVSHLIGSYLRAYDRKYIEKLENMATVTVSSNGQQKAPEIPVEDVI